MITAITVHVDVMSEFPAQDGDDMTDMGDTDGDDWMNVSRSHCLSACTLPFSRLLQWRYELIFINAPAW